MSRTATCLLALASALLSWCVGCRDVAENDNHDGDAGTNADSDSDSDADMDADTDSDSDTDGESIFDAGTAFFDNPCYEVGSGGCLFLSVHHYATSINYTVDAQFFDITVAPVDDMNTETIIAAEGVDTCSLVFLDGSGSGSEGDMVYLNAGAVTVTSGADTADLEMWGDDYFTSYNANLGELGLEPHFGGEYALFASGDEAPALALDPVVTMPADLTIVAPEPGSVLLDAPLAIAWTGGSGVGYVAIEIAVHETYPSWSEQYVIDCVVHDDGEFEVPGEVMGELPTEWYASFGIYRRAVTGAPYGDVFFFTLATVSETSLFTTGG